MPNKEMQEITFTFYESSIPGDQPCERQMSIRARSANTVELQTVSPLTDAVWTAELCRAEALALADALRRLIDEMGEMPDLRHI